MKVALITISDGRGHLTNAVRSLLDNTEPGTFSQAIMVDDSGLTENPADGHSTDEAFELLHEHMKPVTLRCHAERRGGAAAIQTAWSLLAETDCDYAFHLEEDWTFPAPVPVAHMVELVDRYDLANMVLRRQPWGAEGPDGYIGDNPGLFVAKDGWLRHRRGFWLNPCVYPAWIAGLGWPDNGHEHHFTAKLEEADADDFGVYGNHADSPRTVHVGYERHPSWTW